jgi:hypothetical protein
MSAKKIFLIVALAGVVFFIGRSIHMQIAYTEIERLTQQHGAELTQAINKYIEDKFIKPSQEYKIATPPPKISLEYFKVFELSETRAKVFLSIRYEPTESKPRYSYDREGGFAYLEFQNGMWITDENRHFELVWSRLGSADDETWPPYY